MKRHILYILATFWGLSLSAQSTEKVFEDFRKAAGDHSAIYTGKVSYIYSQQKYADQEPEVIELVTEGWMEFRNGGWDISYEESALTGLEGVTTTFRVEPGKVVLTRTGKLQSTMIFEEGVAHDSLYQMPFGALMLTVKATKVSSAISETGGTLDIHYNIEIEDTSAGTVEYHIQISPIQ